MALQPLNISADDVTLSVFHRLLMLMVAKFVQPENISFMEVTFSVLKLVRLAVVSALQFLNMASIVVT